MGIDVQVAVVDRSFTEAGVGADRKKFDYLFETLKESDYPVARHRMYRTAIDDLWAFISALEAPPAVNDVDLDSLYYAVAYYPSLGNRQCTVISLLRNNVVLRSVPEFLSSRSTEATELWHKLIGSWDINQRRRHRGEEPYPALEPPFELAIDDRRYLVEPQGDQVGYLQGDELGRLATALRPHLPDIPTFYESLKPKYQRQAEWAAPVELIYSLATCYGGRSDVLLLTHRD